MTSNNFIYKTVFIAFNMLFCAFPFAQSQNTILWKITHENSPDTSYILGSCHTFSENFILKYPVISEALYKSQVFVSEVSNSYLIDSQKYYIATKDSLNWTNYATAIEKEKIFHFFRDHYILRKSVAKCMQIDFLIFNAYYWMWRKECLKLEKKRGGFLMDEYLQNEAMAKSKKIRPLETNEEHTAIFYGLFGDTLQSIENTKLLIKELDSLITCFSNEKYEDPFLPNYFNLKLNYYLDSLLSNQNEIYVRTNRNKRWLPKIEKICSLNSAFIVVGLGHLQYKEGLIQLLRQKKYIVEPVSLN
jgi:uncharacterized protein YbaP (TraB family)